MGSAVLAPPCRDPLWSGTNVFVCGEGVRSGETLRVATAMTRGAAVRGASRAPERCAARQPGVRSVRTLHKVERGSGWVTLGRAGARAAAAPRVPPCGFGSRWRLRQLWMRFWGSPAPGGGSLCSRRAPHRGELLGGRGGCYWHVSLVLPRFLPPHHGSGGETSSPDLAREQICVNYRA